jgi:hypothetical protein
LPDIHGESLGVVIGLWIVSAGVHPVSFFHSNIYTESQNHSLFIGFVEQFAYRLEIVLKRQTRTLGMTDLLLIALLRMRRRTPWPANTDPCRMVRALDRAASAASDPRR